MNLDDGLDLDYNILEKSTNGIYKRGYRFNSVQHAEDTVNEKLNECKSEMKHFAQTQKSEIVQVIQTALSSDLDQRDNLKDLVDLLKKSEDKDIFTSMCFRDVCSVYFACVAGFEDCNLGLNKAVENEYKNFVIFKNKKSKILNTLLVQGHDSNESLKTLFREILERVESTF
ncbi:hypothetical protein BB560_005524 [Smittium megazygosporum]|uniref:ParB protein family C-terminal domain-containing protein n=1 Tax=Smittium megazygosporum TaxID=133381 RepID=A0A2T9Z415_9FUNG|nr:hypothetical protein BB560_005524 [Smittium megazygosporum]